MIILADTQRDIADALNANDPMTGAELAALDNIDESSVYTLLNRMKAAGITEQDSRDKRWNLTKLGKRALFTTEKARDAWSNSGFRVL